MFKPHAKFVVHLDKVYKSLCAASDSEEFIRDFLLKIREVIPCNFIAWNLINFEMKILDAVVVPTIPDTYDLGAIIQNLNRFLGQHRPISKMVEGRWPLCKPITLSDEFTMTQWKQSDLYRYAYRSADCLHQMSICLYRCDGKVDSTQLPVVAVININRSDRDFNSQERQLFELLVEYVMNNLSKRIMQLIRFTPFREGSVIIDMEGRILAKTGEAQAILKTHFPHQYDDCIVPSALFNETLKLTQHKQGYTHLQFLRRGRIILNSSGILNLTADFDTDLRSGRITISFLEYKNAAAAVYESKLQKLSHREKWILALITLSFTNKEIARDLSISQDTVRNHCYNIYKKIGIHGEKARSTIISLYRGHPVVHSWLPKDIGSLPSA